MMDSVAHLVLQLQVQGMQFLFRVILKQVHINIYVLLMVGTADIQDT